MQDLGARIKEIRKERKMTLAQLAGDRLTKGMMSLIENGKAQPSMESLRFIAEQLNIDVSDLVQKEDAVNFRDLLVEVQNIKEALNETYDKEKEDAIYTEVIDLIAPHIKTGVLKGQTYEEARLYEIYLLMKYYRDQTYDYENFYRLAKMYEEAHAYRKILNPFTIMGMIEFQNKQYERALAYMIEGEAYLNRYDLHIDSLEKLDFYYNMTVMYAAINDEEKTEYYLNQALAISKKNKVYYRLTDFYRFLFFTHLQKGEWEKCEYYLKKSEAFLIVMEDPLEEFMVFLLKLLALNMIEQDYQKTLETRYDDTLLSKEVIAQANVFLNTEYGYAHWRLGQYELAFECLKDLFIPSQNNHPIDLASIYRGFAIRALCLFELGKVEEAKRDILYAMDGVKDFHETIFKTFIEEAYEKIVR